MTECPVCHAYFKNKTRECPKCKDADGKPDPLLRNEVSSEDGDDGLIEERNAT